MELKSRVVKEFLPYVIKPGQYIGNELGAVRNLAAGKKRVVLAVPETYDQAVTDWSVQRLYNLLNSKECLAAERVFLPAPDGLMLLKAKSLPLFSMETFRAVSESDLILFWADSPLQYPQILLMLSLAGLKLNSAERQRKPLILGTGGAFINPEPMREFLDGFVYLWSEKNQAVLAESLKLLEKSEIISKLSPVGGFYLSAHSPAAIRAGSERFSIRPAGFPLEPVVPFVEVDQDKLCFGGNNDWPNYSSNSEEVEGTSTDRIAQGITASMHHSGFEAVKIDLGLFPVDAKGLILV